MKENENEKVAEYISLLRALSRFQEQVHRWYPILHSNFTADFFDTIALGFPSSTMSCLSLLVMAIASLGDGAWQSLHFEAALSMLPTVIQESSITSVQCLILFSIYFATRVQPRQSYDYIQTASLRIQPLVKG